MHYKVNLVCIGRLANLFIYLFVTRARRLSFFERGIYYITPKSTVLGLISTVAEFLRAYVRKIYVRK